MDKLGAMKVFCEVANQGSFRAAASKLNMSAPAVTRAVSQLENNLGCRLLVRTTRSVSLTDVGRRYLEDAGRLLSELEITEAAAKGSHANPTGELRITAPMMFGRLFVLPVLSRFLDQHPQLKARTMFVDRNVDLMDEGLDVGIRIGDLQDSSMIAVRIGEVRQVVVASPSYLEKHGTPQTPDDLEKHCLIQSIAVSEDQDWDFMHGREKRAIPVTPRIKTNTNDAALQLCLAGWGVTRLLSYQVANAVRKSQLQPLLESYELPTKPVHLLHHEGRMVSAKIRAFVDFAVQELRELPGLPGR